MPVPRLPYPVPVEPQQTSNPNDVRPNDLKPADIMLDDVKPNGVKASDVKPVAKPATSGMPVILVAIVGAVAGMAAMLAVVGTRTDAADTTAQPAVVASAPSAPVVEEGPAPTWSGSKRVRYANDGSKTIAFTLAATHDLPLATLAPSCPAFREPTMRPLTQ